VLRAGLLAIADRSGSGEDHHAVATTATTASSDARTVKVHRLRVVTGRPRGLSGVGTGHGEMYSGYPD
jgi:hypothetical protein